MTPVDWSAIATIASVPVAVIGTAGGMWAARRYGTRPGRIEIDARSVQLVGSPSSSEADNEDVSDDELRRYLVQLRFRNRGGRDIPKAAFDGQPLTINSGLNVLTTGTAGRSEAERSDAASGPHPRRLQLAMGHERGGGTASRRRGLSAGRRRGEGQDPQGLVSVSADHDVAGRVRLQKSGHTRRPGVPDLLC